MMTTRRNKAGSALALVLLIALLVWWLWPGEGGPGVDVPNSQVSPPVADVAPRVVAPVAAKAVRDVDEVSDEADEPVVMPADEIEEVEPFVHAICRLEPPLEAAQAYLGVGDPSEFNGRRVVVRDGKAYLPFLEDGEDSGVLTVEGYTPQKISWRAGSPPGTCTPNPVVLTPGRTAVVGRVTHEATGEPAHRAWVEGCGGLSNTGTDGEYYMEVLPGPCQVRAMRQDGMLRTISPPVDVSPAEDADVVVNLSIPGFPRAGLGIAIEMVDEGVLVNGIVEGGAADDSDLAEGDLIVEVDGRSVLDMSLEEFVDRAGGQEGTEVSLVIEADDGRHEIVLARRQLR